MSFRPPGTGAEVLPQLRELHRQLEQVPARTEELRSDATLGDVIAQLNRLRAALAAVTQAAARPRQPRPG